MKLKRWLLGLVIAFADGIINGAIIWGLAPETPLKATCAILVYNAGRCIKDYFAKHPFEDISDGTTIIRKEKV